MLTKENYAEYVKILKEELVPAMGCTEPIAVAYAAAVAAEKRAARLIDLQTWQLSLTRISMSTRTRICL